MNIMIYRGAMNFPSENLMEVHVPAAVMQEIQEREHSELPPHLAAHFNEAAGRIGYDIPDDYFWRFEYPSTDGHLAIVLYTYDCFVMVSLKFVGNEEV
jgi:hypothetical protein